MQSLGYAPRRVLGTALAAILTAGLALRAYSLSDFEIAHWDEGAIWAGAVWFATLGAEGAYHVTISPPLVPFLIGLAAWPLGLTPLRAVWLPVLAGAANILLLYALVRRLASERAALIASALLAVSPLHAMYSRSLLTESFYVLFLLAALLFTTTYLRTRAFGWLLAVGASTTCLQWTKYNGSLIAAPLLAIFCFEAMTRPSDRGRAIRHGLVLGGIAAGAIAVNLVALASVGELARFTTHYAGYIGKNAVTAQDVVSYLRVVTPLPVLYAALGGIAYALWRLRSAEWVVVHLALALYVAFLFVYTFYLRLLAPVSVLLIIYAALLADLALRMRSRIALPVVIIAVGTLAIDTWGDLPRYVVPDVGGYSAATRFIQELDGQAAVLLIAQQHVWPELTRQVHFLPNSPPEDLPLPPDARHVYVVRDHYAYYKYGPRTYVDRLEPLRHRIVARIPNPLAYDLLVNTLTRPELMRLETDRSFREDVLTITIYQLEVSEALEALTSTTPR